MLLQPVLIAGQWQDAVNQTGMFQAVNPAKKEKLPEAYPVSGMDDVNALLTAGQDAAAALLTVNPETIAEFLDTFAANIEARADELVEKANIETALPAEPRLRSVELPRTTGQLRKAATAARDRSWCHATIDTATNIRSKYGPLGGPVVVFGPNNFPFAFNSASGGDFSAAIAAGNPVIAKANTGHPGTTKILAEAAFDAVNACGLHPATVQLIYRTLPEVGLKLVSHPLVGASAFTGSKSAGLKLKTAADQAGKPIYLEMSSINPVFVLSGAINERGDEIAAELFGSCALGAGQFCTNPGLIIVQKSADTEKFIQALAAQFSQNKSGILLSANGPQSIADAIQILVSAGAEIIVGGKEIDTDGYSYANTLLRVTVDAFVKHPAQLQTEAFGTDSLIIVADDTAQMVAVTTQIEGNLTGCIYSDTRGSDDEIYNQIEPVLRTRVGRLLNDKVPTGVAVVPSMNHGGPYPATGHPGFTAVGIPASMLRFAALHCYDNVRHHRLPVELQEKNPTGKMWRFIDGEWSKESA